MEEKCYVVICESNEKICWYDSTEQIVTKKQAKAFIIEYSTLFPEENYKMYKLKLKED